MVNSCITIEAVIYGEIPRAKNDIDLNAPPDIKLYISHFSEKNAVISTQVEEKHKNIFDRFRGK